jgi:DegV family protein with EDD domain
MGRPVIALVTDSGSQLPRPLADRYGITVVPITIVLNGDPFREGVDLRAAAFYDAVRAGAEVSTAAPSPGDFSTAYDVAAAQGAAAVLSIHTGSDVSGTVNSARLAAGWSRVRVTVVDTHTASFPVACSVWEAAEALTAGASLEQAEAAARRVADEVGNVFIVGLPALARRGGRLRSDASLGGGVPILALEGGEMRVLSTATTVGEAVAAMGDYVRQWARGRRLRVGVGDAEAPELADGLEQHIVKHTQVGELVRYEVGPSVGAHTGPGTVGAVFYSNEPSAGERH